MQSPLHRPSVEQELRRCSYFIIVIKLNKLYPFPLTSINPLISVNIIYLQILQICKPWKLFLSVPFRGTEHNCSVVHPLSLFISGTLLPSHTKMLCPLNTTSSFSCLSLYLWESPFNFLSPGTSSEWKQTIFALLCVVYFTKHQVLKLHPCCSMAAFLSFFKAA
jgi:hypothetical protein